METFGILIGIFVSSSWVGFN